MWTYHGFPYFIVLYTLLQGIEYLNIVKYSMHK